jgi:hypothetical protein
MSDSDGEKKKREKFWTEDPCVLFTNIRFFPTDDMSKDAKLNALTRLSLLVTAILYFMNYDFWITFLLVSLLAIILFKYGGRRDPKDKEDFTIVPTYANPNMQTTTVAPIFSEEWQIPPPIYDIYENVPQDDTFEEPLLPQSYPYGQYLTRTNLLPSDEQAVRLLNGGPRQAKAYINNSFMRHELAFRDNLSKIYKKKLARRFRHNTNDTFSPFSSY